MRAKNIYQCDENCKKCTCTEKKNTGCTSLDECLAENCPANNFRAGNVDHLGGRHEDGFGWNPLGEFCALCRYETCEGCSKWNNRDKKLRNIVPPELKAEREKKPAPATPVNVPANNKPEENLVSKLQKILKESQDGTSHDYGTIKQEMEEAEQEIKSTPYVPMAESVDDIDFGDKEEKKAEAVADASISDESHDTSRTQTTEEKEDTADVDEDFFEYDGVDVGDDSESDFAIDNDEYEIDDDDIPPPDDIEMPTEEPELPSQPAQPISRYTPAVYADDDDDEDEDDDAEFKLFEPTKKLKAPILFKPDTKIASYKVRDRGVLLLIQGSSKVIVKGRDDSDGFAYCDPSKFPRYIREGILSGELYKNPNIKIEDGSYYGIIYYHEADGELIERASEKCTENFAQIDEDKVKSILRKAFNRLNNS